MNTQPEALRLATVLENKLGGASDDDICAAAAELRRLQGEVESMRAERLRTEKELRRLHTLNAELLESLKAIDKECFSHVDGRDLFAQLHPRRMLDIKRRVDGRETWYEGDWLSNLWDAIKKARAAIAKATGEMNG